MVNVTLPKLIGDVVYDLDDREPIVDHLLDVQCEGQGELEQLCAHIKHQNCLLRAIFLGCSKKDFRHAVQHIGLRTHL